MTTAARSSETIEALRGLREINIDEFRATVDRALGPDTTTTQEATRHVPDDVPDYLRSTLLGVVRAEEAAQVTLTEIRQARMRLMLEYPDFSDVIDALLTDIAEKGR